MKEVLHDVERGRGKDSGARTCGEATMEDKEVLARQLRRALRVVRETEKSLEAQRKRFEELSG